MRADHLSPRMRLPPVFLWEGEAEGAQVEAARGQLGKESKETPIMAGAALAYCRRTAWVTKERRRAWMDLR